jgi:hypothetical protein
MVNFMLSSDNNLEYIKWKQVSWAEKWKFKNTYNKKMISPVQQFYI